MQLCFSYHLEQTPFASRASAAIAAFRCQTHGTFQRDAFLYLLTLEVAAGGEELSLQ